MSNYYENNFNSVNRYMFIFLNIFVLYFFPYLYFISYIVILYQRLDVDFNIRISNNRLSIDKLIFKNVNDDDTVSDYEWKNDTDIDVVQDDDNDVVQDEVDDPVQDDNIGAVQDDVKIMRKFFDILKNNVDDDDNISVINEY